MKSLPLSFALFLVASTSTIAEAGWIETGTTLETGDNVIVDANTGNTRVLSLRGPSDETVNVTSAMSEIHVMTLSGSMHDTSGDVFALVVRNRVGFDVTNAGNASGGAYFESSCHKDAGANTLTCTGVEASAGGGDNNYSFNGLAGILKNRDGASLGPTAINGNFTASGGNVQLLGPVTIQGATHLQSSTLEVDSTTELHGNVVADNSLVVRGPTTSLILSNVLMWNVSGYGQAIKYADAIAFTPERIIGGVAQQHIGTTLISGIGASTSLADGTIDGQQKTFIITSGSGTIVPVHVYGGSAFTYSSAPASLVLVWDAAARSWAVVSMINMVES